MTQDMATNVLVYGSLKHSRSNHVLMHQIGARCLGYDSITGGFDMVSLGMFPSVIRHPDQTEPTAILGELYAVDESGLAALDALEGHPYWYERIKFNTDLMDVGAWMYTMSKTDMYIGSDYYAPSSAAIWQATGDEKTFWKDYGMAL